MDARHPASSAAFAVLLAVSVVGCDGSSGGGGSSEQTTGLLRPTNASGLWASLQQGFTTPPDAPRLEADTALGMGAAFTAAPPTFTGTYTQEPSVDEFDAVRYDGEHLYVAPRRYLTCCFIAAAGTAPPVTERSIRILATDSTSGTASPRAEIPLPEGVSVQGMYVDDGTLFALTSEAFYGTYGAFWADIAIWQPQKHGFLVYDVRDAAAPALRFEATIDGVFVESRRVGDVVYIVSRYSPSFDGLGAANSPEQRARNEQVLNRLSLQQLLPKIVLNGAERTLVDSQACFVTSDPTDTGYAVITSITAIPMNDPSAFRTTCYNESAYGVYMSATALYLTELHSDTAARRARTRIHKFAFGSVELTYEGSAEIDGYLWRGGQADFRMNEHEGDLRVVATAYDLDTPDFLDHTLYVLRESPQQPQLTIVSQLPNVRRQEEIGKPNEQLFGVRFLGERAYAVTFLRIDPLYAIDLSDPSDPRLAGRLEIGGVSEFLHPVSADLLLGLGRSDEGGIKLELFDVSDLERPLSRGSSTLGAGGSFSEALDDRHAFTYLADVDGVDRFTIPATLYDASSHAETGLYFYEIRDKQDVRLATLNPVGALLPPAPASAFVGRNRAFIHDDAVFYVRDEEVWSALWNAPSIPSGPF
jgi:Beta propeller domain